MVHRTLAVSLTLLAITACASAPGGPPNYALAPAFGTVALRAGFPNDPYTVQIVSGGTASAQLTVSAACRGYVAQAPDFRLNYTAGSYALTFRVQSTGDTTLLINGPDGSWYCDDDGGGNLNPRLTFQTPQSGQYDIWVGSFGAGQYLNSTLIITELEGAVPGAPNQVASRSASGTGFFISSNGYLVTNYHVVSGSTNISVLHRNETLAARVVSSDPANDIAVLRVDARSTPLPIGAGRQVRRGEEVFALGYPLISIQGTEQRAAFGRVNALAGINDDVRYLQIDAAVQPGNSGGPLFGADGTVVGIVTARLDALTVLDQTGSLPENISYALKIEYLAPMLPADATLSSAPLRGSLEDRVEAARDSVVLVVAQ